MKFQCLFKWTLLGMMLVWNLSQYIIINDIFDENRVTLPVGRTPRTGGSVTEYVGTIGKGYLSSTEMGLAINGSGFTYVAELDSNRVSVFSPEGHLVRVWGKYGSGEGQFYEPCGIAINATGYVYVADHRNNRMQVFDQCGKFIRQWGLGLPTEIQYCVAINSSGYVYTVKGSGTICAFTQTGESIRNFTITATVYGMAINDSGYLYMTDRSFNRVLVYTQEGTLVSAFGAGQFNNPMGIALNSTNAVFVADYGNNEIKVLDPNGNFLPSWGNVPYPTAIALNPDDNYLVTDLDYFGGIYNHRLLKFSPSGNRLEILASTISDGTLREPSGIAVNGTGVIFISEEKNHRISVLSPTGVFLCKWNKTTGGSGTDNGEFKQPGGLAINGSGYVYVADTGNHRVQVFSSTGQYITQWGSLGAGDSLFNQPTGIATNSTGHVFVADSGNNRIAIFTQTGAFVANLTRGFSAPAGVTVNTSDYIYVADTGNNRIVTFTPDCVYSHEWGTAGENPSEFNNPRSLVTNRSGTVFVADTLNHRVQVFDAMGTYQIEWGQPGNETACFDQSSAIAITSTNHVLVADKLNHRVQVFGNEPPSASGAHIDPDPANTEDLLNVDYVFSDPDGDAPGTPLVRWYCNGSLQPYLNNSISVPACWTNKSDKWYAVVWPYDGWVNGSPLVTAEITLQNAPPRSLNLQINSGAGALTEDDLVLTFDYVDPDDDSQHETRIRWYADEVPQPLFDNKSLVPACWTNRTQKWNASVEVYDGELLGTTTWTLTVTIGNSLPTYTTPSISPADPTTSQDLTLTPTGYADDDGQVEQTPRVRWYWNNELQPHLNDSLSVPSSWTNKTDEWNATIQAFDGVDYGPLTWSETITVVNSAPLTSDLTYTNLLPTTIDEVTIEISYFDADGDDPGPARIRWYRNGTLQPYLNDSLSVPACWTNKSDVWNATVEPFDGEIYGNALWAPDLTIRNFAPYLTKIEFMPSYVLEGQELSYNAQIIDYDGDWVLATEIQWYRDGVHQSVFDNLVILPTGTTYAGEKWYFKIRVADDTEFGQWVTSPEITIEAVPFQGAAVIVIVGIAVAGAAVFLVIRHRKRQERTLQPPVS